MKRLNKTFLLLSLALAPQWLKAQDRNVNVLYLDGSSHVTQMSQIDRIVIREGKISVVPKSGTAQEHPMSSIDRIVLDDRTATGISEAHATASRLRLTSTADGLRVSGAADGTAIEMYDAAGRLTTRAVSRGGEAVIATGGMPAGTYIVKAGETAYKVVIK